MQQWNVYVVKMTCSIHVNKKESQWQEMFGKLNNVQQNNCQQNQADLGVTHIGECEVSDEQVWTWDGEILDIAWRLRFCKIQVLCAYPTDTQ